MRPTSHQVAPPRAAWEATLHSHLRLGGDAGGVTSRAKEACGLTLRASAPEDVREERMARTFSIDTRVSPLRCLLERVMNLGENRTGMWILRLTRSRAAFRFPTT